MKTLHKKFRSGLSLLALVGLALLPGFSVEADTPGVNDKEIRIGAFGPRPMIFLPGYRMSQLIPINGKMERSYCLLGLVAIYKLRL